MNFSFLNFSSVLCLTVTLQGCRGDDSGSRDTATSTPDSFEGIFSDGFEDYGSLWSEDAANTTDDAAYDGERSMVTCFHTDDPCSDGEPAGTHYTTASCVPETGFWLKDPVDLSGTGGQATLRFALNIPYIASPEEHPDGDPVDHRFYVSYTDDTDARSPTTWNVLEVFSAETDGWEIIELPLSLTDEQFIVGFGVPFHCFEPDTDSTFWYVDSVSIE